MHKYELKDFTRGWIVGDFSPSIIQTKDFEFMVRHYQAGDAEADHVHRVADEVTVIISGEFTMNDTMLSTGDIIHLVILFIYVPEKRQIFTAYGMALRQ